MVGEGQPHDRRDVPVHREVPAPVQPAQAAGGGPGEQEGIPGGDRDQIADVVASREVPEQLQSAPPQRRRPIGARGHIAEQALMPLPGGDLDGRVGRRRVARRVQEAVQRPLRQRVQRRPGLGEFAERGHARARTGGVGGDPQHQRAGAGRGQQGGVHGLAGDPQRLGVERRFGPVRQLAREGLGIVHIGRAEPVDGLAERLAHRFVPDGRGPSGDLGAQPGDPHPGGQALSGPPPRRLPDVRAQPEMQPGQGERRLGRGVDEARQALRETGQLGPVLVPLGAETLGEADEPGPPHRRIGVPDEPAQHAGRARQRIEPARNRVPHVRHVRRS